MAKYILADNRELTRFALESLIRQKEGMVYKTSNKAGLVELLKEHENAIVLLDYTLFDFADVDQLLIVGERFALAQWILISEDLTPAFLRRVVYSSHQFSIVFKDEPLSSVREALQAASNHKRFFSQKALETIISQQEEGFSVQFNDLSTNLPESWNWTFANGTPESSTEQNPVLAFAEEGEYLISLVAENQYGRDSVARTINVVGINDYNVDDMVSIYPNPTSSILNIEAENLVSISIFDMSGKIVYFADENCSTASIDLSGFANAEYMVKVETKEGSSLKRIIKTR